MKDKSRIAFPPARGFGRTHRDSARQVMLRTISRIGTLVAVVAMCVIAVVAQQPAAPSILQSRSELASLPGVRLWFTDTGGRGEPIVLMHAITGTSESWAQQI